MIKVKFAFLVMSLALPVFQAFASEPERDARAALTEYLAHDFNVPIGTGEDRSELVYLEGPAVEPVSEDCEYECGEGRPEFFLWWSDPIIVVDAYSLQAINNSSADTAVADVEFRRVANTRGKGSSDDQRFFVKEQPTTETVRYQLKKIAGRWKVVNPPLPRVSHCRLLELFQESLDKEKLSLQQAQTAREGANLLVIRNMESYVSYYTQQVSDLVNMGSCRLN